MTGDQAALFDAPELPGQLPLFGGPTMTADELTENSLQLAELAELAETVAELAELAEAARKQAGLNGQRSLAAERHADLIAHRRECGNCIPGARPCRAGRGAEKDYRQALAVLSAMESGEL